MGLNVDLLERSFTLVAPHGEKLVARFYERLFKKYPAVKPLFKKTSMKDQKAKLLASLVLVIRNLRHPEKLTKSLQALGARHVGYGAQPAHYDAVGENLLAVLGEYAGPAWTPQVKQAWTEAYGAITTIMLAGARQAAHTRGGKTMARTTTRNDKKTGAAKGPDMGALCMAALDNSQGNVLMCDRNLTITYVNNTALKKLRVLEAEIRKVIPAFDTTRLVGTCIDAFHKVPSKQRGILSDPKNLPYAGDIQLGPLTLELIVTAITSTDGQYLGNTLEWVDVTAKRKIEAEMARLKTSLDNTSTNVMVCDRSYTIVYANKASVTTLRKLENEIRKVMPSFSVDKVVGSSIDQYHKNPTHQRRLLDDPKNLPYHGEIKLGPLTLDLNAAAILSEAGAYLGNVVEWADVTAQKQAQNEVDRLIKAAGAGQLSERINVEEFEGFFKALSGGINTMLDAVVTPLHEAQTVLGALAQGDLTQAMSGAYEGEFEKMKASLNVAIQNLARTITTVRETVDSVTGGTDQISRGNEDLSQRTTEQASALEETSASMEQMTATVKQNADNAKQANQLAGAAREVAEKGGKVTVQAVNAMAEINKSSKKIADIITVIDEIAFQTNLLALNAAVEAARAGEHGRGFAVVAAEVRNLAQRSATAAKEIKGLINESVQRVTDGSALVNQTGQTLDEIVGSVKRVSDIVAEISAASQEQSSGINQVNTAIIQMSEATQENTALVEEVASASQALKEQGGELRRQVEVFKTDAGAESAAQARAVVAPKAPIVQPNGKPTPVVRAAARQPVGVGASKAKGNGHGREGKGPTKDDFEEF